MRRNQFLSHPQDTVWSGRNKRAGVCHQEGQAEFPLGMTIRVWGKVLSYRSLDKLTKTLRCKGKALNKALRNAALWPHRCPNSKHSLGNSRRHTSVNCVAAHLPLSRSGDPGKAPLIKQVIRLGPKSRASSWVPPPTSGEHVTCLRAAFSSQTQRCVGKWHPTRHSRTDLFF